ncbi:RagB/SusD family nutrient uptake outer membrane protein [Pedobacter sp. KBS0701]|uniref:RagB/SusD family nutrient uptake outer membrane protein n=1 Tax=Pedobacter sp. KBS0701 TaxID=2578106 RepID=UPI00110D3DB8|nr:RagB/SusD family nutrient uptake outer membrane protein [Pedobacter sp. KBS0701]QDW27719.1 RagB/SusD family nutrient uptake outer membrane protein [Pedobacter sp. KBS0701]
MKYLLTLLACLLLLSSCSKFLEEYSTDQKYLETTDDLNKVMIGEAFMNNVYSLSIYNPATMGSISSETDLSTPWLHVMDDDSEAFVLGAADRDQATPLYMLSGFHNWGQNPTVNILGFSWTDVMWKKIYKRIGAINALIFQASEIAAKNQADANLQHLRGEAYFLRAYYYFLLQNIYGSPYRKATASTDEGVPLKISEKVEDIYFKRNNNETVYKQIEADLNQAADYLQGYNPTNKIRVGIAAVKCLQSRIYLFTEQYDKVLQVTNGYENMGYSIIDLKRYVANSNFTYRSSTETIFTMGTNAVPAVFLNDSLSSYAPVNRLASGFKASDDLIQNFSTNDLRLNAFFMLSAKSKAFLPAKWRTWRTYNDPEQVSCIFSFRLPEMLLNRAEAQAILGADGEAWSEIQKLQAMRFSNNSGSQQPASNLTLVEFIRNERRRELCFEGHRWFDLRRYAVNSKYPLGTDFKIKHPTYNYDAQSNSYTRAGYYVLNSIAQDQASWQVPIPNYAIEFNRGLLTNPIRSVRNIQP